MLLNLRNDSLTFFLSLSLVLSSVLADDSTSPSADNYIRVAAFSPDGKLLATGSEDRIIRVSPQPLWRHSVLA